MKMSWKQKVLVLLVTLVSFVMATSLQDLTSFGYKLLSVNKTSSKGNTVIRLVFQAPTNTETYWTLDSIPILENDRFSSIRTTSDNHVYTSTLTSSKSSGIARMYSYSFRPFLVRMTVVLYMSVSDSLISYQQGCSYRKPQHTGYFVELDFQCSPNTTIPFHTDANMWFVRNQSLDYEKQDYLKSLYGDRDMILGGEHLFDVQTTQNGNLIHTTLTPRDGDRIRSISLVSLYGTHIYYWNGPVGEVRFQIEDDVDLDGTSSPLYNQNVGITQFLFRPIPLAETETGSVVCEAFGNPPPTVEIKKVNENGEVSLVSQYQSHLFQTRYSTLRTLVINNPSEQDGGNYTCTARSGNKEHVVWKLVWFQPPPKFDTSATTKITNMNNVTITMTVTGLSPFNVECFENSISGTKLGDEEVQLSNSIRHVTYLRQYQTTMITITIPSPRSQLQKVVCQAKDKSIGETTYTVDL